MMASRAWFLIGLLVLALGLGWLGLQAGFGSADDDSPPSRSSAAADSASAGFGSAAESPAAELASFAVGDDIDEGPDEDPALPEGPADAQREAIATARIGPRVRVLRGSPAQPVAAAELFYLTAEEARERNRHSGLSLPRCEWPERHGRRLRSDEQGIANLPPTRQPWLVAAVHDGEFAFAEVPPGDRLVDLRLEPDEQVTIETKDQDNQPVARLPVALLWRARDNAEPRAIWRGRTEADGTAVCRHFQQHRPPPRNAASEQFAAVALIATREPVVLGFAGRPAPEEALRLFVPPTTEVEVTLVDQRGEPVLAKAELVLAIERPREQKLPFPLPEGLDRPQQQKPPGGAAVLFGPVAVQQPLRVVARHAHQRRNSRSELHWTSPDAQQNLQLQLPLHPELAVLSGRLLRPDGSPYGPAEVTAAFWRAEGPLGPASVDTLADGRFDVVLTQPGLPAEVWLDLRVPAKALGDPELRDTFGVELGARVRFAGLRAGERRQLGNIQLGYLPPLCSGVVVDDLGEPIAGADLRLQQRELPRIAAPDPRRGNLDRNQNNLQAAQRQENWRDLPLLRTRSEDDGSFWLGGDLPAGELRLWANTNRHFADSVPLRHPGQQLRISLQRNGILRGRILLPEWVADGAVTLLLRPYEEARRERDSRGTGLSRRGGGRFVVEPLRPGRYDAVLSIRSIPEPLLVLQDLFIPPGEARDPRLRLLDLRQSLFRYRLRAVDTGGRPLAINGPILARLQQQDGRTADAAFRWQRGRAELITGSPLAEIIAFGPSVEPAVLTLVAGDHDVYLRQVQPAVLQLPGARELCGPLRRVRVSVVLTDDTGMPQWLSGQDQRTGEQFSFPRWELGKSNGAWLESGDTVEVPIVRSGKYEVFLRIHANASERSQQVSVSLGTHELRTDLGFTAAIAIPLDRRKVEQALARLPDPTAAAGNRNR